MQKIYKENGKYVISFKAKKGFIYHKAFVIENEVKQNITNEMFVEEEYINNYDNESIIINNDLYNIDSLNIKENEIELVTNIHALEPNYLREC